MESLLELRILSGVQTGAHLTIKESLIIGNSDNCDVTLYDLQDSNITAHIKILEATDKSHFETYLWQLTISKSDGAIVDEKKSTFKLSEQTYLDKIAITVSPRDAAWVIIKNSKADIFENKNDGVIDDQLNPNFQNNNISSSVKNENNVTHSLNKFSLFSKSNFLNTGIKILIGGIVLLFFVTTALLLFEHHPKQSNFGKPVNSLFDDSKIKITEILKSEHLLKQIYLTKAADGQLVVNGWVENNDKYTSLAKALSKISPLPKLAVSINTVILNNANSIAKEFSQYISITYKNGKLDLKGAIANKEKKHALLSSLNQNLPGLVIFSDQLLLFDEVAAYLEVSIKNAHVGKAIVKWDQNKLLVKFEKLNDFSKFNQILTIFKESYGANLPILGQTTNGILLTDMNLNQPPFAIRSVVSGDLPYIIIGSGEKILLGGRYRGFTLNEVSEKEIILDGPNKIVLTR